MVATISKMTYVLLVLLDRHRHLAHHHAHPVREVPTPPQLGVPAKCVISILFQTQPEQLHARCVPMDWDLSWNLKGRLAQHVSQGFI